MLNRLIEKQEIYFNTSSKEKKKDCEEMIQRHGGAKRIADLESRKKYAEQQYPQSERKEVEAYNRYERDTKWLEESVQKSEKEQFSRGNTYLQHYLKIPGPVGMKLVGMKDNERLGVDLPVYSPKTEVELMQERNKYHRVLSRMQEEGKIDNETYFVLDEILQRNYGVMIKERKQTKKIDTPNKR